ncbi:MAG TPA: PD-(D/E)XK nuclease family protein [Daejeonella sp.]|nr:PD-(D/E)XK nuclease family protein [Daejeonella sp.]
MMKPFLQETAEDLAARFGDDLQHCAIVFNNKRPAAYLQKYLAEVYQKAFWSPSFFTVQEFLARSTSLKIADFYTQFFTLHRLYNELLEQEGETRMDMARFFPAAKIILSDFSQIDNDLAPAEKLFQELEDIALINQQFDYLSDEQYEFLSQFWSSYSKGKQKKQQENFIRMWRRMPLLYQAFHEELENQNFITMGMAYRNLAQGKAGQPDFIDEYQHGKLIFVGFNAFSQSEARIFKRWQDEDKALFYFDTDSYYLNDPLQEAGLFLRKTMDKAGLINALDNRRSFMKEKSRMVNVYQVQGHTAQAKILNSIVGEDYKQEAGNELSRTAIVLADENLLFPVLQTIPSSVKTEKGEKNLELNLNVTMGLSFLSSGLFGLADLWLNIQKHLQNFKPEGDKKEVVIPYKSVEAFLTHPLTGLSESIKAKIFATCVKEQLSAVPQQRLLGQKGLFSHFFQKAEQPLEIVKNLKLTLETILRRQLNAGSLKKIDAELFVKTIRELNRLYDTLAAYSQEHQEELQAGFVISLIQKALQSISVTLSGDPLSGIQVMGLLETRSLDFENLVILGLNDGIVPKTTIGNSFIPDSIRRVYGLPVLENQDAISAYMFYRLIQRAEKISLVYNSLTDESNSGEPSRFLKQLEYESGFDFRYFEQKLEVQSEKSETISIEKTPEIMAVLKDFLNGRRTLSASALTTYISNPADFFFKYVAGIKEPEEVSETVEANQIGTVLHGVMEDFYTGLKAVNPYITKERIAEKRKDIHALIEQNFSKLLHEGNPGKKISYTGVQKVAAAIVEEYAAIILDFDEKCAPFSILQMEEELIIPFEFTDAEGQLQSIQIKGIIDRVDVNSEGTTRIVDYKTGSDKLIYKTMEDCFNTHGKSQNKALVQTLFYTYIFEQAKNIKQVEPNLYIVRTMKGEGIHFNSYRKVADDSGKEKSQKLNLDKEFLAIEKEQFLESLKEKLARLFEQNTPFCVSENPQNYQFSKCTVLMEK